MLNLSSNTLTDNCMPFLVEMAKCNKVLKKINLGQNNISAKKANEMLKILREEYGVTLTV